MTDVAGTDRRERQSSFLEPLELEDLDGPSEPVSPLREDEEDPSVFDRVTAVPGELPTLAPGAPEAETPEVAPASSVNAAAQPSAPVHHPSDPPPVLGGPVSSNKRPRRISSRPPRPPSRPSIERPSRRPSTPRQQAVEIEIELEVVDDEEEVTREQQRQVRPDALEVELPVAQPLSLGGPAVMPATDADLIEMKDRYATGDFSGALVIAESILEALPEHEEARRCQARCTDVLSQMYLARLGSLRQVVQVALSAEQIRWLSLDHRAGFLLSLVDGISSIEELLDISSMPRLEALRILYGLLDQRVIALSG